jgi:hypothetical protein
MCAIDLEPCAVWREVVHRARKEHVCDGCGSVVPAGEHYTAHAHVFDGHARSEKMCAVCCVVRESFSEQHGLRCQPWDIRNMLAECIQGERSSPWRLHLAILKRRWRVSPSGMVHLHQRILARSDAKKRAHATPGAESR